MKDAQRDLIGKVTCKEYINKFVKFWMMIQIDILDERKSLSFLDRTK